MKKSKLLTSLVVPLLSVSAMLPIATSCSNKATYNVTLVSKLKERTINDRSGGCSFTFKLDNELDASNTKVKIINLTVDGAETKAVSGLVTKTYDSAANLKVVVNTKTLLTQWPNGKTFTFDLQLTNKTTNEVVTFGTFTFNYDASYKVYDFEACEWSIIQDRLDAYYAGELTANEFASLFSIDGEQMTTIDQMVGLQIPEEINNQVHIMKVIGVKHDTIAEGEEHAGEKALFTFQCVTLLTAENGSQLWSAWNTNGQNFDFTNSILRKNLNGQGTATQTFTKTVYEMLPTNIKNNAKWVTKYVAVSPNKKSGAGNFQVTPYVDKLFPLTYTEIAQSGDAAAKPGEGQAYAYWKAHNNSTDLSLSSAVGQVGWYWLASPSFADTSNNRAWWVDHGVPQKTGCGLPQNWNSCISFGFCI